jgi:MFS family permease
VERRPLRFGLSLKALADRTFRRAFGSRLLVESAVAIHTLYLLFLLTGLPVTARPDGWSAPQAFGALLVISTLAAAAAGFVAGAASDRIGRRRGFVIGGAVAMAVALCALGLARDWSMLIAAQLVFGLGHGVHAAAVAAMTAEILPDPSRAGRDLGVMNMAVALPQALAPGAAALMLGLGAALPAVFIVAGIAALAACPVLVGVRRPSEVRV